MCTLCNEKFSTRNTVLKDSVMEKDYLCYSFPGNFSELVGLVVVADEQVSL